ncbi:MAG: DUF3043 domain-containing protein [bacterium]
MFGRRSPEVPPAPQDDPAPAPGQGKGRPTPTRKEAEAARKQSLKVPKDPKEARKAARERDKQARAASRAALMAGDERALPARDQGPVRGYTRDFVDSRFTFAEYFIFIALAVLLLGLIPNPVIQPVVNLVWFSLIILVAFDTVYILWRLNRALRQRFPDKAERKGALLYGTLRTLQLRRFRLPPPRVKRGQQPPEPTR